MPCNLGDTKGETRVNIPLVQDHFNFNLQGTVVFISLRNQKEAARSGNQISSGSNGFLGLSLNDRTILFLVILLDKTVFALGRSPS